VETSRAVATHIRQYRGDPRLTAWEEGFLTKMETLLRQYRFKIELSAAQLDVVWKITDRIDALPMSSPDDD
jgi:hypothetical protein